MPYSEFLAEMIQPEFRDNFSKQKTPFQINKMRGKK